MMRHMIATVISVAGLLCAGVHAAETEFVGTTAVWRVYRAAEELTGIKTDAKGERPPK